MKLSATEVDLTVLALYQVHAAYRMLLMAVTVALV